MAMTGTTVKTSGSWASTPYRELRSQVAKPAEAVTPAAMPHKPIRIVRPTTSRRTA